MTFVFVSGHNICDKEKLTNNPEFQKKLHVFVKDCLCAGALNVPV
jgi:hypothetical protein